VLEELEKPVTVIPRGDRVLVESDLGRTELSQEDFVQASVGRLRDAHPLEAPPRTLLATVP
jgi:hypothetical protein